MCAPEEPTQNRFYDSVESLESLVLTQTSANITAFATVLKVSRPYNQINGGYLQISANNWVVGQILPTKGVLPSTILFGRTMSPIPHDHGTLVG